MDGLSWVEQAAVPVSKMQVKVNTKIKGMILIFKIKENSTDNVNVLGMLCWTYFQRRSEGNFKNEKE